MKRGIQKLLAETPHGVFEDKNDQSQAKKNINDTQQKTNQLYTGQEETNTQNQSQLQGQANRQGNQAYAGYQNLASTGGINPSLAGTMYGAGGYQAPAAQTAGGGGSRINGTLPGGSRMSGDAQTGMTGGAPIGTSNVPAWLKNQADTNPNVDPYLKTPEGQAYYAQKIAESGGLRDDNSEYWTKKSTLASAGGAVGAGYGNEGGGSSGPSGNGRFEASNPFATNLAATGGVDMGVLNNTAKDYRDIADNPFDSGAQNRIQGDIGNFRSMEQSGGLTDADKNNYLGNGVFKNLSENGGYDAAQRGDYMRQSTSMVPAIYQNMADQMQQRRAVQGGYSPAFSKGQALLARQGSQDMNAATLGARTNLDSMVNANKVTGASGLQQGQHAFSGLQTGNRLAATQGASQAEMAVQDAINRYKMNALNALTGVNQQGQQIQQQGKIAGTGFLTAQGQSLTNADTASANTGLGYANLAGENQRFLIGSQQQGMTGGLAGMAGQGNVNQQAALGYNNGNINSLNSQAGANGNFLGTLQNNANQPGTLGRIANFAGGVIPGVTGMFSGNMAGGLRNNSMGGYGA